MDVRSATPGTRSRTWRAGDGMDAGGRATQEQLPDARRPRYLGCVSLGDFSLHKHCTAGAARTAKLAAERRRAGCPESRKVTRSPAGRAEAVHFQKQDQDGFPLARE